MRFNIAAIHVAAMLKGIASSISIAAIRALKRVLRQCAEALQQYPIAAMRCRVAAALQQRDSCGGGCQFFPWRLVVAVGLLVFVGRGARWSPERSISFAGELGGPLSLAFCLQGRYVVP